MGLRRYWISLLVTAVSMPAIAQAANSTDTAATAGIETVMVTATRRTESSQHISGSIDVLTGDSLADKGVTQMRDLTTLAPSLSEQGSFGRVDPSYFIRGVGTTQFNPNSNSKVGIYVDDVYLNSPAVQGTQLYDVKRVEVARGPQGTLFGQNTTAGLIHTITRDPVIGGGWSGDVSATAGNYGAFSGNGAVGFDLGDHAAVRIAATTEQGGGWQRNTFLHSTVGDADATSARIKLLWEPTDYLDILFNVHGSIDRSDMTGYKQVGLVDPTTYGPCATPGLGSGCIDYFGYSDTADPSKGAWDVPRQYAYVRAFGASVKANWTLPFMTVTSISAYERNRSRINEDTDGSPNDVVHGSYSGSPLQFSQEVRFTSNSTGRVKWIAGAYYFYEDFRGGVHYAANGFGPGFIFSPPFVLQGFGQVSQMHTYSTAGFGSGDVDITKKLKATFGVRYTHERKNVDYDAFITQTGSVMPSSFVQPSQIPMLALAQTISFHPRKSWDMTSWRASLNYSVNDDVLVYGLVSRGFNSGNFNGGAFFDQKEASLVNPEELTDVEIGLKSDWLDHTLRVNASMFHYDFANQQVFVLASGTGGSPVQQLANAAASTLWGGELEVTWKPVPRLLIHYGAGYTHSRFDRFVSPLAGNLSGKQLPSAPKLTMTGSARYDWPLANAAVLSAELSSSMTSHQYFNADNNPLLAQDSYWLFNARLAYTTPDGRLTVAVWGKNLGDEKYVTSAYDVAAFGFDDLIFGPPRTFGVTGSWHFD